MSNSYEINELAKEESWRLFRILGEFVEGFDKLAGIEPAVSVYGSARVSEKDRLYGQIRDITRRLGELGFSIITGGGPGVMEAANRGAKEAGVTSVGLNIEMPIAQMYNPYTTKSITFNHFFVRKVMLVKYATAFLIMPGGLGTLDELTEVLTLIQTQKIKPFPVLVFGREYWQGFLEWLEGTLMVRGYISAEDFNLVRVFDNVDEIVDAVQKWYIKHEVVGRKVLNRQD